MSSLGAAVLQILLVILLTGALFGVVWWRPVLRHGPRLIGLAWIVTAVVLGALGAVRAAMLVRRIGSPAARQLQPINFFVLYAVVLAVVLVPPSVALLRRARRHPASSWAVIAASSAGWSLLGLLLVIVVALALDLGNIPFVPGMRGSPRFRSNDSLKLTSALTVAAERLESQS